MPPGELALPHRLHLALIPREKRPHGIRHEVQHEPGAAAVAQRVEPPEPHHRLLEHAVAALRVGLACLKIGERCHDLHAVRGQELRNVRVVRQEDGREIAPVHHVHAERRRALHELPKVGVQLRGAAGDVEGADARALGEGEHRVHDVARHHLRAVGPRVHVTVATRLVASLADVHLEHVDPGGAERRQPARAHRLVEGVRKRDLGETRSLRPGRRQPSAAALERREHASHGYIPSSST